MNLDFLKDIKIDETKIAKARTGGGGGGHRKQWNPAPELLAVRIWKDGSVFPSEALKERFSLEYENKPAPEELVERADAVPAGAAVPKWEQGGNAFDVIDTDEFPAFVSKKRLILFNVTTKAGGKADLFASVGWGDDGKISQSVMDQGANTFGKAELLPMLEAVYGIKLDDNTPFVDLILLGQDGEKAMKHFTMPSGKNFCFVPKKVNRGEKKGAPSVTRREDPWLFVVMPLLEVHPELATSAPDTGTASVQEGARIPGAEPEA